MSLSKERIKELVVISLAYLTIQDENGFHANISYLENLTEDLDLVDRVIKYIKCSDKKTFENIIINYYSTYILDPVIADELEFFEFVDKIYIKNYFLNKLIYLNNGKVYFTEETKKLAQNYNVTITKQEFPHHKPLIIHGNTPLHEFMYELKIKYKLKHYEVKRFEDNILYHTK